QVSGTGGDRAYINDECAVVGDPQDSGRMVDLAQERREVVNKGLICEHVVDAKTIHSGSPRPFSPITVLCAPQIDKTGLRSEGLKEIGAMKSCTTPFYIEIISSSVDIT